MYKTAAAAVALAISTLAAAPIGHAANNDPSAVASVQLIRDLGVSSRPQTAPLRIISSDAGHDATKLAYNCYYRYVTDIWGNTYLQWFCD
jgi:hypothetical protein